MDTMTLPKRPKRVHRSGQTSTYASAASAHESRIKTILTETLYGTLFFTGIMLAIAAVYIGAAAFIL
jgi:hypothetical protein